MKYLLLLIVILTLTACSSNNGDISEKFYCEDDLGCVDGEYCQVTELGGCVSADWWWENVGKDYDCLPDPNVCKCVNNQCEKN